MSNISYDSEDAARLAELLLAAGRAAEIPRYLRQGALPEMVERELAKPSNGATSRYSSARDTRRCGARSGHDRPRTLRACDSGARDCGPCCNFDLCHGNPLGGFQKRGRGRSYQ